MFSKTKKRVRLHLDDKEQTTVEGFLIKRNFDGHYVLANPDYIESAESTYAIGGDIWILRSQVRFVEVVS